ncbi:hypothetical protein [Bartonella pachyuromydis]|uniref:hypothetical protein n=1 Tax=Bartonella pachyuromydis TaxID=931097 RepID=UPI0031EB4B44
MALFLVVLAASFHVVFKVSPLIILAVGSSRHLCGKLFACLGGRLFYTLREKPR